METVDLKYAKEHLEELLDRAAKGEDVFVSGPDIGTVRFIPVSPPVALKPKRVIGQWKDKFEVPARLFEPLSEDEQRWLSGEESP